MPSLLPTGRQAGAPLGAGGYGGADPHVNSSIDHVPGLEPVGAATRAPIGDAAPRAARALTCS